MLPTCITIVFIWLLSITFSSTQQIEGGWEHTCALDAILGSVYCWGSNEYGQISNGSLLNQFDIYSPTLVPEMIGVSQIAVNGYHSCALKLGSMYCWGRNSHGQLGDETVDNRFLPVQVSGMSSDVLAITAGRYHTCAIKSEGALYCWGANTYGQVGEGTNSTTDRTTPYLTISSGVSVVTAGAVHTCALLANNDIQCWGNNYFGQLGNGNITISAPYAISTPTTAIILTKVIEADQFVMGLSHSCVLTLSGGVYCLGRNALGQLGDGEGEERYSTAEPVSGMESGIAMAVSKSVHSCALSLNGNVYCWGYNNHGQIGNGVTADAPFPILVSGMPTSVYKIGVGIFHSCAITLDGAVFCWGWNSKGQLGNRNCTSETLCQVPSMTLVAAPSSQPSTSPTSQPSIQPTSPSHQPSASPSSHPSMSPSSQPSASPSHPPSALPSLQPTTSPTSQPSSAPSSSPSRSPSSQPSVLPSHQPSASPSLQPTTSPTSQPSASPSHQPSASPSSHPSISPSSQPSVLPSFQPSTSPSLQPTTSPTSQPSASPSHQPSASPSREPSSAPTSQPSVLPSFQPSASPSSQPSSWPSSQPSTSPSSQPSTSPSAQPSTLPSSDPSGLPSCQPSTSPSFQPIASPSIQPTAKPSAMPSLGIVSRSQLSLLQFIDMFNSSTNSTGSVQQLISVTASIEAAMVSGLWRLISPIGYPKTEVVTPGVSMVVALVRNSTWETMDNNTNLLPPLFVPNSQTMLIPSKASLQEASGGKNVFLSVVSVKQSIFKQASTVFKANSTNSTEIISTIAPVVSSDVIRFKVISANGSVVNRPVSFLANISINDEFFAGTMPNMETFLHSCVVGTKETVSFYCILSQVTMNLTCTGLAAAAVERSCPVPQRVCSVLSLSSMSVKNNDYCQAQVIGSGVVCKCGYHVGDTTRNVSIENNILDSSGAINIAVMTRFVSGGIGGNVYKQTSADELLTESIAVFATFGTLLGGGLILLVGVLWKMDKKKQKISVDKMNVANVGHVEDVKQVPTIDKPEQNEFPTLLSRYIWSTIPICFYLHVPWPKRLYEIIKQNHLYFRVCTGLWSIYILHNRNKQVFVDELVQKKLVLGIVQIITTFVTSCAILALVFDLQYPSDDGSCTAHTTEMSCLLRKTPLDASQTYCVWDAYVPPSAGVLSETYMNSNGQLEVLQEVTLEAALASSSETIQCSYNSSSKSVSATVLALVITSLCALPISLTLTFVMEVIRSKPIQNLQNRRVLSKLRKVDASPFPTGMNHVDVDKPLQVPSKVDETSGKPEEVTPSKSDSSPRWMQLMSTVRHTLITWYENNIVQIPELPYQVKTSRRHLLRYLSQGASPPHMQDRDIESAMMGDVALRPPLTSTETQMLPPSHPLSSDITMREEGVTQTDTITDTTNTINDVDAQRDRLSYVSRWYALKHVLHYLTDAEFAMVLLHTWLPEIPCPCVEDDWLASATYVHHKMDLIQAHIQLQFPAEAYATDTARVLCMVLIAFLNVGSLYFISVKGVSRGYGWQMQFLSVCLLNWISETWFLRMWDILVLDFYLPSWVAKDVTRKVKVMIALFSWYEAQQHPSTTVEVSKDELRDFLPYQYQKYSKNRFVAFRQQAYDVALLSQEVAAVRQSLLESQIVGYYATHVPPQATITREIKDECDVILARKRQRELRRQKRRKQGRKDNRAADATPTNDLRPQQSQGTTTTTTITTTSHTYQQPIPRAPTTQPHETHTFVKRLLINVEKQADKEETIALLPWTVVRWMFRLPYWQQSLVTQVCFSGLLVSLVYLWYVIRQKRREILTTSGFLLVVILCVVLVVLWRGHREMKRQKSEAVVVSGERKRNVVVPVQEAPIAEMASLSETHVASHSHDTRDNDHDDHDYGHDDDHDDDYDDVSGSLFGFISDDDLSDGDDEHGDTFPTHDTWDNADINPPYETDIYHDQEQQQQQQQQDEDGVDVSPDALEMYHNDHQQLNNDFQPAPMMHPTGWNIGYMNPNGFDYPAFDYPDLNASMIPYLGMDPASYESTPMANNEGMMWHPNHFPLQPYSLVDGDNNHVNHYQTNSDNAQYQ